MALYENVPKDKYVQFCMKDRNKGIIDLRDKLSKIKIAHVSEEEEEEEEGLDITS